jgi:2-polyprenyl-3-methyl-5-hydroxy-6-metoxy-1,4-benzoquinol methylase
MTASLSPGEWAELETRFWNRWNAECREQEQGEVSLRQRQVVLGWLQRLGLFDAALIEIGCGAGWLIPDLLPFGQVTATDLAHAVVERARQRVPEARLVAGDFMRLDFPAATVDVAVSLEVRSHVPDQAAFLGRVARLLTPGGHLMLATQNLPVLRRNRILPPAPGQLRRWVDRTELRALLVPHFEVVEMFTVTPLCNRGPLRLVTSYKVKQLARLVAGQAYEGLLERLGLGWTTMALARRRAMPR